MERESRVNDVPHLVSRENPLSGKKEMVVCGYYKPFGVSRWVRSIFGGRENEFRDHRCSGCGKIVEMATGSSRII